MVCGKSVILIIISLFVLPLVFAQDCYLVGYRSVCPDGYVCWGVSGSFSGYCKELGWVQNGGSCENLGVNTVLPGDEFCASGNCDSGICCDSGDCCTMNSDCPGWMTRSEECNTATYTCVEIAGKPDSASCWDDYECQSGKCQNRHCCPWDGVTVCCQYHEDCVRLIGPGWKCDLYNTYFCIEDTGDSSDDYDYSDSDQCTMTLHVKQIDDKSTVVPYADIYWNSVYVGTSNLDGDRTFTVECSVDGSDNIQVKKNGEILSDMGWTLYQSREDDIYVEPPSSASYESVVVDDVEEPAVTLYEHCGFGGKSWDFYSSVHDFRDYSGLNDAVSAFVLRGGYKLLLYEDVVSQGRGYEFDSSKDCLLEWDIDDAASSLEIVPVTPGEEVQVAITAEEEPAYVAPVDVVQTPQVTSPTVAEFMSSTGLVVSVEPADGLEANEVRRLVEQIYPEIVVIFDEYSSMVFTGPRTYDTGIRLEMTHESTGMWDEGTNTLYIPYRDAYGPMGNYPVEKVQKNSVAHELAHYHLNGFALAAGGDFREVPAWFREGICEYAAHKYYKRFISDMSTERTISQHRYDILVGYLTDKEQNHKGNVMKNAIKKISWDDEGDMDDDLVDYDHIYYGAAFSFIDYFLNIKEAHEEGTMIDVLKYSFIKGSDRGFFDSFKLYASVDDKWGGVTYSKDELKEDWFSYIDEEEGIVGMLDEKPGVFKSIGSGAVKVLKFIIPFW